MNISKDYILLILNCKKYRHKANIQKNTWLHKLPTNISYYHVIGDISMCNSNEYIFDEINNLLYVNSKDDYLNLPHKIITAIKAVNDTFEYKYIFKTDDDQILLKDNFFETLINILDTKKNDYGGFNINVKDHITTYWTVHPELPRDLFLKGTIYCNGRFYLLSNRVIQELLTHADKIKKLILEDHSIGLYIDNKFKKNILNINTNNIFIDMDKLNLI